MPAGQRDTGFPANGAGPFEHLTCHLGREFIDRPAQNGNGQNGFAPHGIDIADGVGRGNTPKVESIVDNGHKEIGGADDGFAVAQVEHGGIIAGVVANQQARKLRLIGGLLPAGGAVMQDFIEDLGGYFAAAASPVAILRQFDGGRFGGCHNKTKQLKKGLTGRAVCKVHPDPANGSGLGVERLIV